MSSSVTHNTAANQNGSPNLPQCCAYRGCARECEKLPPVIKRDSVNVTHFEWTHQFVGMMIGATFAQIIAHTSASTVACTPVRKPVVSRRRSNRVVDQVLYAMLATKIGEMIGMCRNKNPFLSFLKRVPPTLPPSVHCLPFLIEPTVDCYIWCMITIFFINRE